MYRIEYDYWKPVKKYPQYGKYGKCVKDHIDGETLEQVCKYFDEIRYHHDVVENSTIEFIRVYEIA